MSLELKKLEMDLLRCQSAKAELLYKKEERLEDIKRIEDHIKLQEEAEIEIKEKLHTLKEGY